MASASFKSVSFVSDSKPQQASSASIASFDSITQLTIDIPRGLYYKRVDPRHDKAFSVGLDTFLSSNVKPIIGTVLNVQDSHRAEILAKVKVEATKHMRDKLSIQSPNLCKDIVRKLLPKC